MTTSKLLLNILPLLVLGGAMVYAAAPSGGYLPGVSNNPDCAPGDTDCFVQAFVDTDIQNLSLTGTTLSIERGNSIDLSTIISSTTEYAQTVFIDTLSPSTATLFDTESPATLNNPALASDSNNIYIGTDGSSWIWNGSTYITKIISDSTAWKLNSTETDAGASKTGDIWRNGKIGIGTYATNTITSSGSVRINMDSSVSTANTLVLYNPNQASTAGNSIAFRALTSSGTSREMAYIRAQYIDHGDTTRSADMYFSTASGAAAQNRMIIKNNGNIGFGTITPGSNFSLNGIDQSVPLAAARNFPAMIDINSSNTASGAESNILFTSNYSTGNKVANASIASLKETSGSNADYGQASLVFRTSGNSIATLNTEKMRIMGNGNIGIGNTNPGNKLSIQGTGTGTNTFIEINAGIGGRPGIMLFGSNGKNARLGIATAIQQYLFQVSVGDVAWTGGNQAFYMGKDNGGNTDLYTKHDFVSKYFVIGNGNVGIDIVNPSTKLDVAGNIKVANSNATCASGNAGEIRYDTATNKHQGCNGTIWNDLY